MDNQEQLIAECIKTVVNYPDCQETCPYDLLVCDTIYPVVQEVMIANDVEEILDNMEHDGGVVPNELTKNAMKMVEAVNQKLNLNLSPEQKEIIAKSLAETYGVSQEKLPKGENEFYGNLIADIFEAKLGEMLRQLSGWEQEAREYAEKENLGEVEWVKVDAKDAILNWRPGLITFGVTCFFYGVGYGKVSNE